jgi:Niemann-Pick C1 protein
VSLDTLFKLLHAFPDVSYINGIQAYFTPKYFNETYKSCSRVSMPSSGQLALDLMCGEYGSSRCSPEKWFHYMGDNSNPFVPFQIDYIATDKPIDGFKPMDPEITPCNKPLNVRTYKG